MIKKLISVVLVSSLVFSSLTACSNKTEVDSSESEIVSDAEISEDIEDENTEDTIVLESDSLLSEFDITKNTDYIMSTVADDKMIYWQPVKLFHNLDFKVDNETTTMKDHIIFDDSNYTIYDGDGESKIISYEEMLTLRGEVVDKTRIESLKLPCDNIYYDVIVVDGYSSVCSDTDISNHYNTLGGVHEKSKNGTTYSTKFKIKDYNINVNYKYGYDKDSYCLDIVATYPSDYDGLRILGLGQDRESCSGGYAHLKDEDMRTYIDKKDLSKIFKVWGTENDNDMLELTTYSDFIFSYDRLDFDISFLVDNQYFFGGALALGFDTSTHIYSDDGLSYEIPLEMTWGNMLMRETITVFNPLIND